jgi:hypothetical protein
MGRVQNYMVTNDGTIPEEHFTRQPRNELQVGAPPDCTQSVLDELRARSMQRLAI